MYDFKKGTMVDGTGYIDPILLCDVDWACSSDTNIVDFVFKLKWSKERFRTEQVMLDLVLEFRV